MEITEDGFLGGNVRLRQPAKGYRAGADAILLAAAVEASPGETLMEAGTGAGAALIAAARFLPGVRFFGIERDAAMALLASENAALNGMADRAQIIEGDALAPGPVFDGVFTNPPFDEEAGAQPPHPARRASYLSDASIDDWIKALANRLSGGAMLTLIQRAQHLPAILAALEGRLGGVEVLPLRPQADLPAKRILVRARKGGRAPLRLLKGLDLHDAGGAKFTPEADAIFRGDARVIWK
ncbi:MAG TPA: methyltransferase [Caulobacterales bacterium]|nr:methyltransferase [Caulobacterales bacterium]